MTQDMEENGIQIDIDISKMIVRSDNMDRMLGVKDEQLKEFSTSKSNSEDKLKNVVMSSLLSSVSTSHEEVTVLSKETLQLSDPRGLHGEETMTISSMKKGADTVIESSITEFLVSNNVTGALSELTTTANSTASSDLATNSSLQNESYSLWSSEEIGAVTVVTLMVPFILISNLFVIMSVVRFRRLHTPTNYFITSLAAVDIFVALAVPFVVVVEVFHFDGTMGPGNVVLCLLPNRVLMMTCGVSLLTLATIAYDRHTALVSPLEYVNIMTTRKVAIMVTLTWIYSAVIVWLPLAAGWYDNPTDVAPCSANLIHGKAPVLFLSAIFAPSCIAIMVCYFRIFLVARHHAKAIAAVEFAVHRRLQVKFMIKDTKYAKTLALVIGVFLALWLPYLICVFIKLVSSVSFSVWVQTYLILLAVFNSGINPWIYAFKNNEFRAAFNRMFKDFCRDKLCKAVDRRASLVSAVSSTPRLSRTDSRMVSIVPEVTVDTVSDRLKRSLDSLDEYEHEVQMESPTYDLQKRRQTIAEEILAPASIYQQRQSGRQAASCTDLNCMKELGNNQYEASKIHRSVSMDFILPNQTEEDTKVSHESLNDSGIYNQISIEDLFDSDVFSEDGLTNQNPQRQGCRPKRVLSMPPHSMPPSVHLSSPSSSSLPSSPIHLQPPPKSPRRSPRTKSRTPVSPLQRSQTHTPTPPSPAVTHHTTASPTTLSPSLHHLGSIHSFCYVNEALQPDFPVASRANLCTESSAIFHPYFENMHVPAQCTNLSNTLSLDPPSTSNSHMPHTQSCPSFQPLSLHSVLAYMNWDGSLVRSSLAEHTTVVPLEHDVGYVRRISGELENTVNGGYFV